MILISNKMLREFASLHPNAEQPLQDFRRLIEQGTYGNFGQLKATFASVDKVGERFVFNTGGNKYSLIAAISFQVTMRHACIHGQMQAPRRADWRF